MYSLDKTSSLNFEASKGEGAKWAPSRQQTHLVTHTQTHLVTIHANAFGAWHTYKRGPWANCHLGQFFSLEAGDIFTQTLFMPVFFGVWVFSCSSVSVLCSGVEVFGVWGLGLQARCVLHTTPPQQQQQSQQHQQQQQQEQQHNNTTHNNRKGQNLKKNWPKWQLEFCFGTLLKLAWFD